MGPINTRSEAAALMRELSLLLLLALRHSHCIEDAVAGRSRADLEQTLAIIVNATFKAFLITQNMEGKGFRQILFPSPRPVRRRRGNVVWLPKRARLSTMR